VISKEEIQVILGQEDDKNYTIFLKDGVVFLLPRKGLIKSYNNGYFIMKKLQFIFLFIIGCSDSNNNLYLNPEITDVHYPIPSTVPVNPFKIELIGEKEDQVYLYNNYKSSIQKLDLLTGNILHEITISKDGINKINAISGFTRLSEDSILITSNPPEIILINGNGDVLQRKKITNNLIPLTYINSFHNYPLLIDNLTVYGAQPLFMDHHGMNEADILKHQLIFEYDIKSNSIKWHDVFYPEDYWKDGKKVSNFSWAKRENKIYIAPWYDHDIIVYDLDLQRVEKTVAAKSHLVKKFKKVNNLPTIPNEGFINDYSNDQYYNFLYDPYRELFYRIVLPSFDLLEETNYMELFNNRQKMTILVLNNDLELLGEYNLNDFEAYTAGNIFISSKGLHISTNNSFNKNFDENNLKYKIFKF